MGGCCRTLGRMSLLSLNLPSWKQGTAVHVEAGTQLNVGEGRPKRLDAQALVQRPNRAPSSTPSLL